MMLCALAEARGKFERILTPELSTPGKTEHFCKAKSGGVEFEFLLNGRGSSVTKKGEKTLKN